MSEYFERELKYKYVIRDEHGAPVHPDTRKRTVRICCRKAEFFLNVMFFLIFPFAICCLCLKKPFRQPARRRCCSDESKVRAILFRLYAVCQIGAEFLGNVTILISFLARIGSFRLDQLDKRQERTSENDLREHLWR
ncbi:uncharacterized protein LOC112552940 [Pogonomyrmex barbatus]|uniref:Uncharacterized protein LOC112552940 n=1 Tax=Pogonomyrmex barbatus TaxID=144034 RepID=A0A8N1SAW9_9HYME|nr:uncharacterized protein LOC112552940 [Pogonomyrmex barbatus]